MARHKSALVALKNLEKSYEQHRRALLRQAEDEISATVNRVVGELAGIAKDFPKLVSSAVAALVHAPSSPPATRAAAPAAAQPATAESNGRGAERFRAMGVKAHRAKMGLSQDQYGKLVGVSGLTIYQWESGKTKPREPQRAKWLAIRGLGKEEALGRLGKAEPKAPAAAKAAAPKKRNRGSFKVTAEEMILALLKGKNASTSEIHGAWKKSGRGVGVDQTLSKMVAAKKLIRKPLGGKKGSEYSVA